MNKANDKNQYRLGDVIKTVFKQYGIEDKMLEMKIISVWETLMGAVVAKHTDKVRFKKGVLNIYLSSSSLRNELMLSRELIIRNINRALDDNVVKEIYLR
jgi:hypothetical protein